MVRGLGWVLSRLLAAAGRLVMKNRWTGALLGPYTLGPEPYRNTDFIKQFGFRIIDRVQSRPVELSNISQSGRTVVVGKDQCREFRDEVKSADRSAFSPLS